MNTSLTPVGDPGQSDLPSLPADAHGLRSAEPFPEQGLDVGRLLLALRRFRWLILACLGLGIGAGILATRYVPPEYEVQARVWIQASPTGREPGPIRGQELLEPQAYVELLKAFAVLDPVVREERLYLSVPRPADTVLFAGFDITDRFLAGRYDYRVSEDGRQYTLTHRTQGLTRSGAVGDSVGRDLGFLWRPSPSVAHYGKAVPFEVLIPREVSVELAKRIRSVLREQNFLILALSGPDPEATATTLNRVVERFVGEAAYQKRSQLTMLAGVLDSQVTGQAQRLKTAEEQFESFRVGTVTLPRENVPVASGLQLTQPTVYGQFFQLRTDRDAVRRDRESLEEVLVQAQGGALAVDAFQTISVVRTAPDLQRVLTELSEAEARLRVLLARYTEEHRDVKEARDRISTIRNRTLPLYTLALINRLRDQEQELTRRIDLASAELRQIPARAQTESRLRREWEQAEELYRSLASSQQQARLAEASAIPDVRVLDWAVAPTRPSRNTAPRIILLFVTAGLGLGLALAVLLDRLDRRVRYPQQVSKDLGLPILGAIPQIRKDEAGASPEEAAQVVEAFRSVRMSLTHSYPDGKGISLAISSPAPGDGKSLIAANLALSFAEAGYRTVLVDGDIRRGDLHRTFSADRRPGLLDHLANGSSLDVILRPTSHGLLKLIPCGTRFQHGPELLGSVRMHDLVTLLQGRFDVIIFDSPPLGAGIDPFVLGTATGNLALILRAGETDRQLAEAKLQILDRLPIRMLGAILNDVRVGEGPYRYYSYSYGYVAEDENGNARVLPAAGAVGA
jgi:succinoglycan biosynthesis transport protein ExoP